MKIFKHIIIVVLLFVTIITLTGCTDDNSEEADELNKKKEQCSAITDTYNKCSYSVWEARCVCKRR